MVTFECSFRGAAKAGLQRKAVYQLKLLPHYNAGSGLSALLDLEARVLETEILVIL